MVAFGSIARTAMLTAACLGIVVAAAAPDPALRTLVREGHYRRAQSALEPRLKANPNDAEASALMSRVRLAFGSLDDAVRLAEAALKVEPNNADYHWWLAEAVGRQAQRAGVLKQFGLARRFKKEAEAALALDHKMIEPRMGLITFYAVAPGIVGGDTKKSLQMVDEIAQLDRASGFIAKIRYLDETKEKGDVEALLKQALDAAVTPETQYEARGSLMNRHLGATPPRLDAAAQMAREMVKIAPGRQGGYAGLAIVFATEDKFTDLDALLAEAERAIPDNLNPYFQAGRVLQTRGADLARAERYLKKYLSLPPEGGMPGASNAFWRMGLALEKMGRKPEAVAALRESLRVNPDFEPAQKDLKRLK